MLVPIELRGQELVIHADGEFKGDVSWTCEAISNIIKKFMEHTPEGGRIEIQASEHALYTEILIKDNGTVIAKLSLQNRKKTNKLANENSKKTVKRLTEKM